MSRLGRSITGVAVLAAALPPLSRWAARTMLLRNMRRLDETGDVKPLLSTYAKDVRFTFPGDTSWAGEYVGREAVGRWVQRFHEVGLKLDPHDIVIGGPPWNTKVVVHFTDQWDAPAGDHHYRNSGTIFGTVRWGRMTEYAVYEDTHRSAALDAYLAEHPELDPLRP